jgi:hypothetical protein
MVCGAMGPKPEPMRQKKMPKKAPKKLPKKPRDGGY